MSTNAATQHQEPVKRKGRGRPKLPPEVRRVHLSIRLSPMAYKILMQRWELGDGSLGDITSSAIIAAYG